MTRPCSSYVPRNLSPEAAAEIERIEREAVEHAAETWEPDADDIADREVENMAEGRAYWRAQ